MKKATIKEIHRFLKTLEENRYRKLVKSECRRIAWFVNNDLSEDYDAMPDSLRKKWVKAEYKKEKYLAKKFLEYLQINKEYFWDVVDSWSPPYLLKKNNNDWA